MTTIEDNDVVDIAEYAARGEKPPRGRRYRFRLDREPYISTSEVLTGAQILAFGSLDPQHFNLFQAIRGGQRIPIAADQEVDLTQPGIERFFSMKNEHTNGDGNTVCEFELPIEDLAVLAELGLTWEARMHGSQRWLIVHGWRVPDGFQFTEVSIALRIDPNYPMTQIDMAYFQPALARPDGRELPAVTLQNVAGGQWQQWSRHRKPDGWRPGVDNLESHLAFVTHFLTAEVA
jgi:hypothetical protein